MNLVVRRLISCAAAIAAVIATTNSAGAAPTVWTGTTVSFSKPAFAMPSIIHDFLTDNVRLARGNSQGLYNIAKENLFSGAVPSLSPFDTAWATNLNNPAAAISASNWASLSFTNWTAAYAGAVGANFDRDAVVHLISDDVYLNLRFTSWAGGNGGGAYSYVRTTPVPEPATVVLALTIVVALAARRCSRGAQRSDGAIIARSLLLGTPP